MTLFLTLKRLWRRERIQNRTLSSQKHLTTWKSLTLSVLHSCVISNSTNSDLNSRLSLASKVQSIITRLPPSCLLAAGGGIVSNTWTDQWISGPGLCVMILLGSTEIPKEPTKMGRIIRADTVKCMSFHYQDTNLWIPFTGCNKGSVTELIICEVVNSKMATVTGQ